MPKSFSRRNRRAEPRRVTARPADRRGQEVQASNVRALRGANYWQLAPVIACDVTLGSLDTSTTRTLPGFAHRMLELLPGIASHACSRSASGQFGGELDADVHIAHALEHVATELQILAGCSVAPGCISGPDADTWCVVVAYEEEALGIASVREAVNVVRACIDARPCNIGRLTGALQNVYAEARLGPSTAAIVQEARSRGIPVRRLDSGSRVQLGLGRNLRRIQATLSDSTSSIAVDIAQDKEETKRLLRDSGVPVPHGQVVRSLDSALAAAERLGYPVILKPLSASQGRGVSSRINEGDALESAWEESRKLGPDTLVEKYHEGRDFRVLVVGGKMVACAERIPAHVVGDGVHSVRELIEGANRDPRRGAGHRNILTLLPLDDATRAYLSDTGRTLETVPAAGEMVQLRATANLSTGGTSIDRTDEIHPDNVTVCEMATDVIGLDIAGIDIVSQDISVPFRQNGATILEVNAAPGIRMHTHPCEGTPRNVAAPIVDLLYPPGQTGRIPVIAVTGTNGKTTTVRLIAHLFRNAAQRVGMATTDGVYLQNRLVLEGDLTGPFGANMILSNPNVDVAVLETARGGLLRSGLGYEDCDVGIVLNVSEDHLGLHGINDIHQLAAVKGIVPAVVRRDGYAILNADDPLVLGMRARTAGNVALFSAQECGSNAVLEQHVADGGIGACMAGNRFEIRRGRLHIPIAEEREVPLTLGGAARFARENILAAALAAYVSGVQYDAIRAGLLSFFPSPLLTPGRMNLVHLFGGAKVVVDYAHNPAAIAGLVELARNLPVRRRVAVAGMPGDRRDTDLREGGRLCAAFDHVILKEDSDLRGRAPNAVAQLMREGARNGGLAESAIEIVNDELQAVERGLAMIADDDLLVILANDVDAVLEMVCQRETPEAR